MTTNTFLPAAELPPTPTDHSGIRAPYEMRSLTSDADRAAAAALVEDRARTLAERGITVPRYHAAAFRSPQSDAVGLYEDTAGGEETRLACLLLHRTPAPSRGKRTGGPRLDLAPLHRP
ncbi:hypothetical protein ACXNSR_00305 [Streptomyces sp. NC-S4]